VTDGQAVSGMIANKVIAEQDVQLRSYQVILMKVLAKRRFHHRRWQSGTGDKYVGINQSNCSV